MRSAPRSAQRGFMGVLVIGPLFIALVMAPLVAARTAQVAEQKRLDAEVRAMLKGKKPVVTDIAADAALQAEVEQNSIRF